MGRRRAAAADLAGVLLRRGRAVRLSARGSSMLPFLVDGDVVHVRPARAEDIGVGDVLCYDGGPGRLFLHRVVAKRGGQCVTRGDALEYTEIVAAARVLGTAIAVERGGRLWRLDGPAGRALGRAAVLVAPVLARLLAVAVAVRRRWRVVARG
jgi:hypothetical protein